MGYLWHEVKVKDSYQQMDNLVASAARTPFYRSHWKDRMGIGERPPVVRADDLEKARRDFPESLFGGRLTIPEENLLYVWPPVGAVIPDTALFMGVTVDERENLVEVLTRQWARLGLAAGDAVQVLSWSNDPFVSVLTTAVAGSSAFGGPSVDEILGVLTIRLELVPSEARRTLATAELLHPAVIVADYAHVAAMNDILGEKTIAALGYQAVIIRSMQWVDADVVQQWEDTWHLPVRQLLEIPHVLCYGLDCEISGRGVHFAPDKYWVEVTNQSGEQITDGSPGFLTITPLFLRSHPLIRYQTAIVGYLDQGACGCETGDPMFVPTPENR